MPEGPVSSALCVAGDGEEIGVSNQIKTEDAEGCGIPSVFPSSSQSITTEVPVCRDNSSEAYYPYPKLKLSSFQPQQSLIFTYLFLTLLTLPPLPTDPDARRWSYDARQAAL